VPGSGGPFVREGFAGLLGFGGFLRAENPGPKAGKEREGREVAAGSHEGPKSPIPFDGEDLSNVFLGRLAFGSEPLEPPHRRPHPIPPRKDRHSRKWGGQKVTKVPRNKRARGTPWGHPSGNPTGLQGFEPWTLRLRAACSTD
jgi:hypothetical protein